MAEIEYDMMKPMMAMMMMVIMLAIITPLIAQAAPPAPTYCCAIHARLEEPACFFTYAELEAHFATAHPSVPIDIGWE